MSKKPFQLKDQDTGFFDPETATKIVRDQVVEIDMGKRVGRLTTQAIRAGRLIEVNREPTKSQKSEAGGQRSAKHKSESDLPEDFPAREALIGGGFDSLAKVNAASDDELLEIEGVGAATVEKIRAAL